MTSPVTKTSPAAPVSVEGQEDPCPPGNGWMQKAWEDCIKAWPVLAFMMAIVVAGVAWGIGVEKFIDGHSLMIEAEKAKIVLELNNRYVKTRTFDTAIEATDTFRARILAVEDWQDNWVRAGQLPDDVQQNTDIDYLKKDMERLKDWRDTVRAWMLGVERDRGNPE